jgi:hypothetical protein
MNSVERYYNQQADGLPYFAGPSIQQGHGLGGIFSTLFRAVAPVFRAAAPVAKAAAKTAAREAAVTGASVLSDLASGRSLQESAKQRTNEAMNRMVKKGAKRLTRMTKPKSIKRKRKRDIFSS